MQALLCGSVWDQNGIRLDKKLKVYKAVVLPTLLYACETWTVYQRHAKRLNHFHTSCLRKLLKIKWQDRIPDTEVLKRAGMQSVQCTYSSETGTVKMGRPCYQDAWGTFAKENPLWRTRNGQMLPWWSEEAIQRHPQSLPQGFQHSNRVWEQIAQDQAKWWGLIRRGASEYEAKRTRSRSPGQGTCLTFFRGDWSWNIFYGHSLPSADSTRAVVTFWRKNVHNTG